MRERTDIEKILDAMKKQAEWKKDGKEFIPSEKIEAWNKAVEDAPYNRYFGVDIACLLAIVKGIKKGLTAKDALYISKHYYNVDSTQTIGLIGEYTGETKFYSDAVKEERKGKAKRLLSLKKEA